VYSYYGSCGIIINSIFQNNSQPAEAFGEKGWKSLFDNANTVVFLGGNKDSEFLNQLSTLIGQHDMMRYTVSNNGGWLEGEQQSLQQEPIFSAQQLAEMPQWRGIILSSTNRATLVKVIPWFKDKKIASSISASLKVTKQKLKENFSKDELTKSAHDRALERPIMKLANVKTIDVAEYNRSLAVFEEFEEEFGISNDNDPVRKRLTDWESRELELQKIRRRRNKRKARGGRR
jgi:type IV secretory pathway TraG/TraD family ATPase VirD4